jgi:hypothetical protein
MPRITPGRRRIFLPGTTPIPTPMGMSCLPTQTRPGPSSPRRRQRVPGVQALIPGSHPGRKDQGNSITGDTDWASVDLFNIRWIHAERKRGELFIQSRRGGRSHSHALFCLPEGFPPPKNTVWVSTLNGWASDRYEYWLHAQ